MSNHCHQSIYVFPFNKLCSRDFILRNNLFFEEGVTHEDVLWSLRLSLNVESLYVVPEVTYHYYIRKASVSGSEKWRDEVRAYIHILPLMDEAFSHSPHKAAKADKYHYFDDILKRRYQLCFFDELKEEYIALRAVDPRPATWVLRHSIGKSYPFIRGAFHRLLPVKIAFPVMLRLTERFFPNAKKINPFRSIHYHEETGE